MRPRVPFVGLVGGVLTAIGVQAATPIVRGGGDNTIALHADGSVRTWGNDYSGALGVGRQTFFFSPVPVQGLPGTLGILKLSAGTNHTLALLEDGSVWAWGDNTYSQLGDGTSTLRPAPVRVTGLARVRDIAAGEFHSAAVTDDGNVWTWGYGAEGELGVVARITTPTPIRAGISGVSRISAGARHVLALKADGSVWAWGDNEFGQLGNGEGPDRANPTQVEGLPPASQVSGGGRHSLIVLVDGSVRAWGRNQFGQLGDGTRVDRATPVAVTGLSGVAEIAAGGGHSVARTGGIVWTWGDAGLAAISSANQSAPAAVGGLTGVTAIAAGGGRTFAVMADGSVWGWGQSSEGELGDGTSSSRPMPVPLSGWGSVAAIAAGGYMTVAAARDGRALASGSNVAGQLGNGTRLFRSTASVVPALTGVVAVEASFASSSYAVVGDGAVWSWGGNDDAQLGDASGYRSSPAQIAGLADIASLSPGGGHVIAVKRNGTLVGWGRNDKGQVGNGSTEPQRSPVELGIANIRKVAAGKSHSLALTLTGEVLAWGSNGYGELGDGTTAGRSTAASVRVLSSVIEISAGENYSAAVRNDGTVWVWGRNQIGLLGDGSAADILVPVQVTGLAGVAKIAAANYHLLVLKNDRSVWAWGWNDRGQLGDGTTVNRSRPVAVAGLADMADIAAKNTHSTAVRSDGTVWTWGENGLGELGDGTLVNRSVPVVALREDGGGNIAANTWFLDLDPGISGTIPAERVPVFPVVVSGSTIADVQARLQYRPQDVGTTASVFVFAYAPATIVQGTQAAKDARFAWKATGSAKAAPVACQLAQLNTNGQLVAVSAASLQAYVTGVLSSQGQSVNILNGVPPAAVGGATFFVGYGANGEAMLIDGKTRSAVTVEGATNCRPQPPQTGWWYNPAEGGRGFSIEARGNVFFFAAFHYNAAGRPTWNYASGRTSLDGSLFTGDFWRVTGGQTLTAVDRGSPRAASVGSLTLAFSDAGAGTMFWPGGPAGAPINTAIERQPIVQGGLAAVAQADVPESGWWWNPDESGRGFFIEWQNGYADLAGYMYDETGEPIWYISAYPTPNPRVFGGNWWQYGGATGGDPTRATRINDNVGPVAIEFSDARNAVMTLPGGRRIPLTRQPI